MLLVGLFSWWYGLGWLQLTQRLWRRVASVFDFFSIGPLAKTLFAPFKQISVGSVRGSVETQLRAWADAQLSRVVGAMVRLAVILFGLLAVCVAILISLIVLLAWPLVPILPIVMLLITFGGSR